MSEIKKSREPRDYKERFEFELTVGNNIICQRYFRINNFNPTSLRSYELTDAIRRCVAVIDRDLKDKTHTYLEMYAPKVFSSVEEMTAFLSNSENVKKMTPGEGLVVRGNSKTDYVFVKQGVAQEIGYKFDDGELSESNAEDNKTTYKFAFKVDGREVCTVIWDGYYPKFVRDKIDLSNKRGKFEGEDISRLSFEQYLLYKMVQGKSDLIYGIIMHICTACSFSEEVKYTTNPDDIMAGWKQSRHCDSLRVIQVKTENN
jgi:hypothetical protein